MLIKIFCNTSDEFDEVYLEETGFSIGIKGNTWALALKAVDESEPTHIQYDLTATNFSNEEVLRLLDEISNSLNKNYSFTIPKKDASKIEIIGKNELSEIDFLVYELEPIVETPIIETDDFYLFYDNTKGFGASIK